MANEKDKTEAVSKFFQKDGIMSDMQENLFSSIGDMSGLVDKIKPFIGIFIDGLKKQMKEHNLLCILKYSDKNKSCIFSIIDKQYIESINISDPEKAIKKSISIEDLLSSLLNGSIDELFRFKK